MNQWWKCGFDHKNSGKVWKDREKGKEPAIISSANHSDVTSWIHKFASENCAAFSWISQLCIFSLKICSFPPLLPELCTSVCGCQIDVQLLQGKKKKRNQKPTPSPKKPKLKQKNKKQKTKKQKTQTTNRNTPNQNGAAKPTSRKSHLVAEMKVTAQLTKMSAKWWSKSVLIIKWCKRIKAVQDKPFWHKLTCLSQWAEKFFNHKNVRPSAW